MWSKNVPVCSKPFHGTQAVSVSSRTLRGCVSATRCLPVPADAAHGANPVVVDPVMMTTPKRSLASSAPLAAAAVAAALFLQLSGPMSSHDAVLARAVLTPDEKVAIEVYKKAKPSVVNVTNMSIRR